LSSNNNKIYNNSLYSNYLGIWLTGSGYNNITENNFFNNIYSLSLGSSGNRIYHNNFINSTNKPFDSNDNQWDDGYPSGGNFWSDYIGEDRFSGLGQNIPGNDGIGDTNYSIDSDSVDNFPLMSSIGPSIFLYEGWNLISIPRNQPDTDLGAVLSPISGSYKAVQWLNASHKHNTWKHNSISKPAYLNDFEYIDHTMGFWIYITQQNGTLFRYQGAQPTSNQSIQLYKGWNMVGYPSLSTKNRTSALNNLEFGAHIEVIWSYNAAKQKWVEMGDLDSFYLGKGYRIHATQDCVWEVPL
jgi:parallel beta-helix repeat protein